MAKNQATNVGSSPPSSNEATHIGTPSTNITAMSPDACPPTTRARLTPRFNLRVNTFAPPGLRLPAAGTARLSPTAEEFTPSTATFNLPQSPEVTSYNVSPVRTLVAGSTPDLLANAQPSAHGAIGQASRFPIITDMDTDIALSPWTRIAWEKFSKDEVVTRTFEILDQNYPLLHHIIGYFPVRFLSLHCIDTRHFDSGIVRLSFHDDRDAKQAYVLAASLTHFNCQLTQLPAKQVAAINGKDPSTVSNYEGQVLVTMLFNSRSVMPTVKQFHDKLQRFGKVRTIHTVAPGLTNTLTFRVEYHDVRQAHDAVRHLHQVSNEDVQFLAALYQPDVYQNTAIDTAPATPQTPNSGRPSLTGRTTVPSGDLARLENVMARVMRETPSSSRPSVRTGHNVVDIGRIEAGIDVRTTIMLRNIPNRVDQATLKALLDETSFGDYDFMYLRIDFANNCNVGYAFINFVDPLAIIPFALARAGQRWNIFSSDKIAEISYATIQGRDCLIQKFRNSSVMLEHPSYCPKLYITRPSPFAGQEEPFPEPDNYSKMRRSIDNAEHIGLYRPTPGNRHQTASPANVRMQSHGTFARPDPQTPASWSSSSTLSPITPGLFAPREGQAHREEQRRRRSQYDRGTPGAEIELSSYRLTDAALDGARAATVRLTASLHGINL